MDGTDLIEIHQLLAQYGHCLDARDWQALGDLFVDDAVLDYTPMRAPAVLNGVAEIIGWFSEVTHPSAHHVTNIVAVERDGEVHVHSKWIVPYTRAVHQPKRWAGGDYHDIVTKTAAGWRFARKECVGRWQLTMEEPGVEIEERRRTY